MLTLPALQALPSTLPLDGAIAIELQDGIPIFRASHATQQRIETLLEQQQTAGLAQEEELELDAYEEMDDYISFVNRTIRNLAQQTSSN
ncbi:MAG: hypothetical protein F6K29_34740 [Okeania sp. SIO2G5]|nr:hypothetical protein [Okeania sp. SIO2G5]